jgi:hypothetical protein
VVWVLNWFKEVPTLPPPLISGWPKGALSWLQGRSQQKKHSATCILVVENDGPILTACGGAMRVLNRNVEHVFDMSSRRGLQWVRPIWSDA